MFQRAAVEQRLEDAEGQVPGDAGGRDNLAEECDDLGAGVRAVCAGEVELRHLVGDRHADVGARHAELGLRRAYVGPLFDQGRGQAERQLLGQVEVGEVDVLAPVLVRQAADQCHQLVALLRKLALQRRQGAARLFQRRLLRQHLDARRAAQVELASHQAEQVGRDPDRLFGGGDLRLQRREIDGGGHDVRGQGQIGRLELEALILYLSSLRFDRPPHAAEDVEGIGDAERGGTYRIDRRRAA